MPLTPPEWLAPVRQTVLDWMVEHDMEKEAAAVVLSRNFTSPPPAGYGQAIGAYRQMCREIIEELKNETGITVTLTPKWINQHATLPISRFIGDLADLFMKAAAVSKGPDGGRTP